MNFNKIILPAAFFFFEGLAAQQTAYFQDHNEYKKDLAAQLYDTNIYGAAKNLFAEQAHYYYRKSAVEAESARFYENLLNIILEKNHAEKGFEKFSEEFPNSVFLKRADLPLADYYLIKKDFGKALEILSKNNGKNLSDSAKTDYTIKLGYAKFMTGDADGAMAALSDAYQSAAETEKPGIAYMLGHLNYAKGNIPEAFNYFDSIKNDEKYAQIIKPYYVQLYFNQKNYDQAISEGNSLLNSKLSEDYKAEVHKIIGESYFMKQDYAAALPHLKIYLDGRPQPTEKDLYEMGFVSAQNHDYSAAVSYYNQLTNAQSALAQNAYYQLGNAYLQTSNKQEALAAFRSAYQMDYDPKVKKLAHEQYAKIGYEIGNPFEAPAAVIQNYIKAYPTESNRQEMRDLLIKNYLYSGNYRETLEAIDQSEKTPETDKISQEVSFLLGTEEYNKGNFDEAAKYFEKSLKSGSAPELKNRATYWLAQTFYQKNDFAAAVSDYEKLKLSDSQFPEKDQLSYDLGYAYFKFKNFQKAQQNFTEYLKNPRPDFEEDARLRLADTYYAENRLAEAIEIYDKSAEVSDYILFQKAMAQGFKGDTAAKISSLKNLQTAFPKSGYADDANYEIATAYAAQEDFTQSGLYFDKVISQSKDPELIANAKIYKAQNLADAGKNEEAIAEFKRLGTEYNGTGYAQKIVQTARPVFLKIGDVSDYQSFAKSLNINLDKSEVYEINLAQAKSFYADKQYLKAIPLYEKYLKDNFATENSFQAKYELGESYFQTKNSAKAMLILQEVTNVQNDYQEDAQVRTAQILISGGKNTEAKAYLEKLLNSSNTTVRNYAVNELLTIYAYEKDYAKAENLADKVLSNKTNSFSIIENSKVIKARALLNNGRDKEAQNAYSDLEKSSNPAVAAESLYAKAYFQNLAKAYKTSNETIFRLANNYSAEQYWGAKALLVMAKNYSGLKDKYQATYTLDQIIANYADYPEIVNEARVLKNKIK